MTALAQANAGPGSRQLGETARLSNDVPEKRGYCSSQLSRAGTREIGWGGNSSNLPRKPKFV